MNVHAIKVVMTTSHSVQRRVDVDSQTASSVNSIPRKRTRADARIVGTYGTRRDDVKNKAPVRRMTRNASNLPPPARVKKTEYESC